MWVHHLHFFQNLFLIVLLRLWLMQLWQVFPFCPRRRCLLQEVKRSFVCRLLLMTHRCIFLQLLEFEGRVDTYEGGGDGTVRMAETIRCRRTPLPFQLLVSCSRCFDLDHCPQKPHVLSLCPMVSLSLPSSSSCFHLSVWEVCLSFASWVFL